MIDTSEARAVLEKAAAAEQIVPGTGLRSLFAMLRPNDLVFNYLVSGWLMGKSPAPFDVLAWNDDALGNRQYPPLGPAPALTCTSDRMRRLGFFFMIGRMGRTPADRRKPSSGWV